MQEQSGDPIRGPVRGPVRGPAGGPIHGPNGDQGAPRGGVRADRPATTRTRRAIATFPSYREAERAVDFLSDQGFPVDRVAIVGRDLRYVEEVTGRVGYPQAALRGAGQGALIGLLLGWLFGLFSWVTPVVTVLTLAAYGLVVGAIIGALIGLLMHALSGGQRDFASVGGVQANQYDLLVDDQVAEEAARRLGTHPGAQPG
jgi:hypothetical protein